MDGVDAAQHIAPANSPRVAYVNRAQLESGQLGTLPLIRDYVLSCRFLGCGIMDRTRTLDQGFPHAILDPIPAPGGDGATFGELCDARGDELVREAISTHRRIRVLWSGGIDSTTALIAVLKATERHDSGEQLEVLMSLDSVHEYPRFFLNHIYEKLRIARVVQPVSRSLDPADSHITGEHGDQLFGSHLLASYVARGVGDADYRDVLPLMLLERLKNPVSAYRVQRYLQPVIDAAPVPLRTLFDVMWWLNFALKWQEVSLRLCVYAPQDAHATYLSLRHFFQDERFQGWALSAGPDRCPPGWARYKDVAKHYIRAFTGDEEYFRTKEKEDSLRNIIASPSAGEQVAIWMCDDFRRVVCQLPSASRA